MEDSSEDLPKPQRRTAARPFFSPRPDSGEGASGPLELNRRRAGQLFTPPGSSPATPLSDRAEARHANPVAERAPAPASSAADGSTEMSANPSLGDASPADTSRADASGDIEFEGDWTAPPLITPERTIDAASLRATNDFTNDDQLVVEQFEHEEIELRVSASSVADEHSIEVIGYDDANSLLKAATSDGKNPEVDGLQLESTEFSFEHEAPPPRMNVDSFWASEPFGRVEEPEPAADAASFADETEATIDEETAGEPPRASQQAAVELSIEDQPLEWADDPSTVISHAQAALEPEPEHDPFPAREHTSRLADISPPWMSRLTPASSQSLEQLKESEPWDLTPSHGIEKIPEEQQVGEPARELARGEPAIAAQPAVEASAAHAASAGRDVADALVRIAARVRDGQLEVPSQGEMSDEATLSAVLTALLRMRR
jgi:hypothetical protein